jgi:hypothetical protein
MIDQADREQTRISRFSRCARSFTGQKAASSNQSDLDALVACLANVLDLRG